MFGEERFEGQFLAKLKQTPAREHLRKMAGSGIEAMTREAELRTKALLILLSSHFQVVRLFFLTFGFSFWALLLVKLHGFGTGKFRLCIAPFRKNDQP